MLNQYEDIRHRYTADELEGRPTLATGQADDLKVETTVDGTPARIWLCRVGVADGMIWERSVTLELLRGGRWVTVLYWDGDDPYGYEIA